MIPAASKLIEETHQQRSHESVPCVKCVRYSYSGGQLLALKFCVLASCRRHRRHHSCEKGNTESFN